MKTLIIPIILLVLSKTITSFAGVDEDIPTTLEPVLVTASRMPTKLEKATRSVTIISAGEIENMPVNSVPELLNYVAGIDMRQRNIHGVQADAGIRGSSFEQVLILIDGVNVNDPQTGHHSLDLPIVLEDIEKIEVLRGHGSSLYGANAFGGVINIISKKPDFKRRTKLTVSSGSNETYRGNLSRVFDLGRVSTRLSLSKDKSDGYRAGTDFDNWGIFSSSSLDLSAGLLDFSWGFQEKEFGADKFYSFYPSWERTRTKFAMARFNYEGMGGITIEPKIYYRGHDDKFVLIRENPDIYTNDHENLKSGGEVTCYLPLNEWGDLVFGGEMGLEEVDSKGIRGGLKADALGEHRRRSEAVYAEYRKLFKDVWVNLGARFDHNSQYGDEFSPSFSLGGRLSHWCKLRFSLGRSFRSPTITELYYEDPRKMGNADLDPEQAWSYEFGGDINLTADIKSSITFFMRREKDLIDWVGLKSDSKEERVYHVKNISEVKVRGIESQFSWKIGESTRLKINYTFIHKDPELEERFVSLYALDYSKHLFNFCLNRDLIYGIKGFLGGVYKKRVKEGGYFTLDLKLSKKLGRFSLFIDGTNILDKKYEDILGADMPGTWIMAGVKMDI